MPPTAQRESKHDHSWGAFVMGLLCGWGLGHFDALPAKPFHAVAQIPVVIEAKPSPRAPAQRQIEGPFWLQDQQP